MKANGENMKGAHRRTGGSALMVAGLLVVLIAITSTGEQDSDLATDASELPTSTVSTTTAAPLLAKGVGEDINRAATAAAVIDEEGPPRGGLRESESNDVSATTSSAPAGPAPVRIARPSCAAGLGAPTSRTAPFTGLSAAISSNLPAVLVKVSNNNSSSRAALIGLDQADLVFEERIEASATRFAAVFHSSPPPNVGPVRSGRTTDIQITQNLNRPVMGYSGSNPGVATQIRFAADRGLLVPYVNTDSAPFARDGRFKSPDNLFVDPTSLGACGGGGNPTPIFSYGTPSSTTAQPASSVSFQARSPYRFDWDGSRWVRSQDGYAHTTRTGAPLAPANVVVLFVPYVQSAIDAASVDAQTIGSGAAWMLRDGTITTGSWSRAKGHLPYTLSDGNGIVTTLAPGQTWVVLAPAGSASFG
jgi:hypothetical protein